MALEETIDIAAPPSRVWAVVVDVARWQDWTPTITSVELLDGGPLRVGSRARIRQPRLPTAVWTVTALEPGRYFEWRNVTPGVASVAGHRVDGTADYATRVTLSFAWLGWLAPLLQLLYGKLARRYVRTEAESLRRWCEREG